MKTLKESVAYAMDIPEQELLPFLPYILQDFWGLGSDPDAIIDMARKHLISRQNIKVLDPGCGKGFASIKVAKTLGYTCYGIDAIPEFIDYAVAKATEYNVSSLCKFEVGNIRVKIRNLKDFDIIILGSVGQVFGNYYETLKTLDHCLNDNGLIIIDDGYIEDDSGFDHPQVLKKQEVLNLIDKAGMSLIDEVTVRNNSSVFENYETEFVNIERRCQELIIQHPEKADMFYNYIKTQREEYDYLKSGITCSTMVIKRKG